MGEIRTSDDKYYQAWIPFVTEIGKIIAANQVTTGGVRVLALSCVPPPIPFFSFIYRAYLELKSPQISDVRF